MSLLASELELNGLEASDELQINTVTQQPTQQNPEKPKPICHHCKKPGHYRNQSRQVKHEKDKDRNNTRSAGNNNNNNGGQTNSNSNNKIPINTNANNTNNPKDRNRDLCTYPVRPVVNQTIPQKNVALEQMQLIDRLHRTDGRKDRIRFNRELPKTIKMGTFNV